MKASRRKSTSRSPTKRRCKNGYNDHILRCFLIFLARQMLALIVTIVFAPPLIIVVFSTDCKYRLTIQRFSRQWCRFRRLGCRQRRCVTVGCRARSIVSGRIVGGWCTLEVRVVKVERGAHACNLETFVVLSNLECDVSMRKADGNSRITYLVTHGEATVVRCWTPEPGNKRNIGEIHEVEPAVQDEPT